MLLTACEKPFEPIQANDYIFSIYGHLEATADTHWVRVTPIRTTLETLPGPIDAIVTLEEVESGTMAVMADSLVRYLPVTFEGEEVYAHNFFTTMPIVAGRHYRLTATRSDGAKASATVLIPLIQDPELKVSNEYYPRHLPLELRPARGEIRGMRYLAMVIGVEDIADGCPVPTEIHQEYLRTVLHGQAEGQAHYGLLEWVEAGSTKPWDPIELRPSHIPAGPPCRRDRKRIAVVASGAAWPQGESTSLGDVSRPKEVSNIEGGVGFLAGVQTHVFPFERCLPLTSSGRCTIRYSSTSARLVGFVTNFCDGAPVAGAIVAFRGSDAAGLRADTTSVAGEFDFQGIDPGVSHYRYAFQSRSASVGGAEFQRGECGYGGSRAEARERRAMPGLRRTAVHITGSVLDAVGTYVVCRSGSLDCAGRGRDAADPLGVWEPLGRRSGRWAAPLAAVAGVGLLAACEKPFEPLQPGDFAFSIYGHLEAGVDTQWVRVTPIRTSLETSPGPVDAIVTVEELETGLTVVMSDSLTRYLPVSFDEGEVYAHNFFTTMPMVAGRHYRLTATRSDGAAAAGTVLIPVIENPAVEWAFRGTNPARGQIRGMRHIGMLRRLEEIPAVCGYPISVHQQYLPVVRAGQGSESDPHTGLLEYRRGPSGADPIEVPPPWVESFPNLEGWVDRPPGCERNGAVDIVVVASDDEWAYGELSRLRDITHPTSTTNIEGGLGFLAGVQRWVFPFESCIPSTTQDRCEMKFSAASATFHGIVTNNCGVPLDSTAVLLRGNPGGVRITATDMAGRFRYRAIDPGVPYSLTFRPGGNYVPFDAGPLIFGEAAVDTLSFSTGALPCG